LSGGSSQNKKEIEEKRSIKEKSSKMDKKVEDSCKCDKSRSNILFFLLFFFVFVWFLFFFVFVWDRPLSCVEREKNDSVRRITLPGLEKVFYYLEKGF